MADKYVKLDDVIETLELQWGYEGMREDLMNLPTADVAPRAEWISVEEMVPDCEQGAESKAVLFITKQGFMYTGYYGCGGIYHDRYFREYKNSTEGYDISSVTHWMPLPEPPEGD